MLYVCVCLFMFVAYQSICAIYVLLTLIFFNFLNWFENEEEDEKAIN